MQKLIKPEFILFLLYFILLFPKINLDYRGIAFLAVLALFLFDVCKGFLKSDKVVFNAINITFIFIFVIVKILNYFFIHSNILSGLVFVLFLTVFAQACIGKRKFFWFGVILVLLLPLQEYAQIFLGTPLRFFSANTVSKLLGILNICALEESGVIVFENNIINIDYICSGNSTILTLFLFCGILGWYYNLKINWKVVGTVVFSIFLFVFLNIFRILTLILLDYYSVSNEVLKILHPVIGLFNFSLIFIFLCYSFLKISGSCTESRAFLGSFSNKTCKIIKYILFAIAIIFLSLKFLSPSVQTIESRSLIKTEKGLNLSEEEMKFFASHKAIVEKTKTGNIVKLTIKTNNWHVHHNPINCIKASGFKIKADEILAFDKGFVRKITTDKGYIYYYFTDGNVILDDYYKKTFLSIFSKTKDWTFVEFYSIDAIDDFLDKELER